MQPQNKYDDPHFFARYSEMPRSVRGLEGAGEWYLLRDMLPRDLVNKDVLDLGCGYGWHCRYVRGQGAGRVVGVDVSEKMLERAAALTNDQRIVYQRCSIEELALESGQFDLVVSSLAFHYVCDFGGACRNVWEWLRPGGSFFFSVEHPVFTAVASQDWCRGDGGEIMHWPVDGYFAEGLRETNFLGHEVRKYHRTLSTYMNALISAGFVIVRVCEPVPSEAMLQADKKSLEELRRPMFFLVSATKKANPNA